MVILCSSIPLYSTFFQIFSTVAGQCLGSSCYQGPEAGTGPLCLHPCSLVLEFAAEAQTPASAIQ
jgi:hypothetical protein